MKGEILDIDKISFKVSVEELIQNNTIPPKFRHCTFENYYPDKNYPSQQAAKDKLQDFITNLEKFKQIKDRPKLLRKFSKIKKPKNIYLDGVYGVGKTHLAAACGNKFKYSCLFLSFSELMYLIAFYRLMDVVDWIKNRTDLIIIDEFELDDPGDAMMGINFIREMDKTDCLVLATSNTLPSELGMRKLDILVFKERVGSLINSFDTIIIDGKDYRLSSKKITFSSTETDIKSLFSNYETKGRKKMLVNFEKLLEKLAEVHPFRYNLLSYKLDALFIEDLRPFDSSELLDALRFTHLIDSLYYGNVEIFASGNLDIFDLFDKDLKDGKFKTKIGRCLSRLSEKCTLIKHT